MANEDIEITQIRQTSHPMGNYEGVCVIKNFRNLDDEVEEVETSPTFFTGQNDKYEWDLDIYVGGWDNEYSNYVSIRFFLENEDQVENVDELVGLCFIASIIDEHGKEYSTKLAPYIQEHHSLFKDFVLREDLLSNPKLLPNGELRIGFKIGSFDSSNTGAKFSSYKKIETQMLGKVFDVGKYTDFKFAVGDKEFNVHRAILAARSPVFEAMFDSKMRESNEGKVEIVDVEAKVMEKLLRFVYVSEVKDFEELAGKILIAAEKYQIDELKQLCEDVLVEQLSLANVYDTLRLADENNAENLKKKSIEFFHRNSKELSADVDFKVHLRSLPGDLKIDIICDLIE